MLPDEVLKAWYRPDRKSQRKAAGIAPKGSAWTERLVLNILRTFPAAEADYDTWLKVGMALHAEFGEDRLDLWDEWSRGAEEKYDERTTVYKWNSFERDGGVAIKDLFRLTGQVITVRAGNLINTLATTVAALRRTEAPIYDRGGTLYRPLRIDAPPKESDVVRRPVGSLVLKP